MQVPTAQQKIRFGAFELDRHMAELYKHGTKLKLQGQPIAVLGLLLERPGELVTRDELRERLWPEDVDFAHSLNTHIKKLRQVFDDDSEAPALHRDFATTGLSLHCASRASTEWRCRPCRCGEIRNTR